MFITHRSRGEYPGLSLILGSSFFTDDVKYVTRPFTALNYTLLGVGGAIILTIVLSLCAIIGIRNRDKISSLFTNEDV